MRGCALRKVVRDLAHKKLENRGVEPLHLPSQIPRPAPTGWSPVGWWMAEKTCVGQKPGRAAEAHDQVEDGGIQQKTNSRQRFAIYPLFIAAHLGFRHGVA